MEFQIIRHRISRLLLLGLVMLLTGKWAWAADFYWIGGSGNWTDLNHWATASGGSVTQAIVPSSLDRVFFDGNSFPSGGTVTINAPAFVKDFSVAGVPAGTGFNLGVLNMTVSGSMTLQSNITWTQTTGVVILAGTGANTIGLANVLINNLRFNCPGGTYTATSAFRAGTVDFQQGSYVSNGQAWTSGLLDARTSGTTFNRSMNFTGTDTLRMTGGFQIANSGLTTLTMGGAVIKFTEPSIGTWDFYFGGKTVGDVVIRGTQAGTSAVRFLDAGTIGAVKLNSVGTTAFAISGAAYNFTGNIDLNYARPTQAGPNLPAITIASSSSTYRNVTLSGNGNMNPNFTISSTNNSFQDVSISGFGGSFTSQWTISGNNNTFRDVTLTGAGTNTDLTFINITAATTTFRDITASNMRNNLWTILGATTSRNWTLNPGATVQLSPGVVQNVTQLNATGTCGRPIVLEGRVPGSQGIISQAAGSIIASYVLVRDVRGQGGATFAATNAVDLGGNTGWTFTALAPQTLYWVGGSGNWSDINHWRTSSGGATLPCGIPTMNDDVVFDNNSFTAAGQAVTQDMPIAFCRNMTWTPTVVGNPNFVMGVNTLEMNGSLDMDPAHQVNAGTSKLWFSGRALAQTIDAGGKSFYDVNMQAGPGEYRLTSLFTATNLFNMNAGTFRTNGQRLSARFMYGRNTGFATYTMDLTGTDTVYARQEWQMTTAATAVFTVGTATIKQDFPGAITRSNFFGGKTYMDWVVNVTGTTTATLQYSDVFNGRDFTILRDGTGLTDFLNTLTMRDFSATNTGNTVGNSTWQFRAVSTYRNMTFRTLFALRPFIDFQVNATATGTVDVGPGNNLRVFAGRTLSAGQFVLAGACDRNIIVTNNASPTQGILSQATGTVSGNYLELSNSRAQGGATFNALNAIDNGNNTGWNITPRTGVNLFWVGNSGNWNDPNHWALASGGPGNGCIIPSILDNVFFDQNSFTAAGQTVTLNVNGGCNNFTWSGTTIAATFNRGNLNLDIRGSLTINNQMTFNNTGSGSLDVWQNVTILSPVTWNSANYIQMRGTGPGNTVRILPTISHIRFMGGGTYTLQNALNVSTVVLMEAGTFVSAGHRLITRQMNANTAVLKDMNFAGTDTVFVSEQWVYAAGAGATLHMNGAVIKFNTAATQAFNNTFTGGGFAYGDIVVDHRRTTLQVINFNNANQYANVKMFLYGPHTVNMNTGATFNDVLISYRYTSAATNPVVTVSGNNTFNDFTANSTNQLSPILNITGNNTYNNLSFAGVGMTINLGANRTQTCNQFSAVGTGSYPIYLLSTTQGTQANITQASGTVCLNYLNIRDINGAGGATFFAGYTSNDLGNNVNWVFQSCLAYYWVGGTGDWSDLNHWVTTSGGSVHHVVLPTQYDDVFFDINSFTGPGETVNINVANPRCKNMNWTTALFSPTVIGSGTDMNIFGSLDMTPAMAVTWSGSWNFKGTTGLYNINTAGVPVETVNLVGPGGISPAGTWTLQNTLNAKNVFHRAGTFNTNSKAINAKFFRIPTSSTKSLNLSNSTVTLTDGAWDVQDATGLSFNPGLSQIVVNGVSNSDFIGADLTYHNVRFTTTGTLASTLMGNNVFNVFRVDPGLVLSVEAGSTQAFDTLVANATCTNTLTIQSTVQGTQAYFSQASGTATANFIRLEDNKAMGGATFQALKSDDLGNNTDWTFTPFPTPTVSVSTTPVSCGVPNNGTALANASGGDAPYTYLWNNSATTQAISQLLQGTYTVTVTDLNGCVTSGSGLVQTVGAPDANFSYTPGGCSHPGTSLIFAPAVVTGGNTYAWDFGDGGTSTATNPSHSYALPGNYIVQLTVTDPLACQQSTQQTVAVCNAAPVAQCQSVSLNAGASCSASPGASAFNAGSYDPDGDPITVSVSPVAPYGLGITTVVLTVTDNYGASSSCTASITVTDATPPTITCPAPVSVGTDAGQCTALVTYNTPVGNDNCSGVNTVQTTGLASGAAFPLGTTTNTFVVNDGMGLTATCAFTVTVSDLTAPVVTCQNITVSPTASNPATVTAAMVLASVVENCGSYVATLSPNSFTCSQAGQTVPVTVTVTDAAGNSANCTAQVTVSGSACNQPPVAVCQNLSLAADGSCMGVATASQFDGGSSDPNGDPLSYSVAPAGPYGLGTTSVVLTVSDGSLSSTCSAIVTVTDQTAPSILCPANVNVNASLGVCAATVSYATPVGTDNCAGATTVQTAGLASGATFPVGVTTNAFTVTDGAGLTSTCSFTVTVLDLQAPIAQCQPVTVSLNASGTATTTAAAVTNGSSDNCGVLGMSLNTTTFTCANVGANTVVLTVTDVNGNASTCSAVVTVLDPIAPTITCPANISTGNDPGTCGAVVSFVTNTELYTVSNTDNLLRRIHPTSFATLGSVPITLPGFVITGVFGLEKQPSTGNMYVLLQVNGTNNRVIATVNMSTGAATYVGQTVPRFASMTFATNGTLYGVTGDGDPVCAECLYTVDPNTAATTLATALGNGTNGEVIAFNPADGFIYHWSGQGTFPNRVYERVNPTTLAVTNIPTTGVNAGQILGATYVGAGNFLVFNSTQNVATMSTSGASALVGNTNHQVRGAYLLSGATVTDNCTSFAVTQVSGLPSGTTFPVGTTTNVFQVTDAGGNTATCSFTVTVTDQTAPVAQCQGATVILDGNGQGSITAAQVGAGSSDNCGPVSMTLSNTDFDCADLGTQSTTLTVTDASGNTAVCNAAVSVVDNTAPTALCNNLSFYLVNGATATVTTAMVDGGSTDNCGVANLSLSNGTFTCAQAGPNNVTLTVADGSGNTSTCVSVVTITTEPLACSVAGTNSNCAGNCTGAADLSVSGGCGSYTYAWSNGATTEDLTGLCAGTYTVTVTDGIGGSSTCSVTIAGAGLSTATLDCCADTAACLGDTVYLPVQLGGTAPWNLSYTVGGGSVTATVTASPYLIPVVVTGTLTVSLTGVSAVGSACPGTVCGHATIGANNCGGGGDDSVATYKFAICHVPPGNPGNAHTLYLPQSAIPAHLNHGDYLGTCDGNGPDTLVTWESGSSGDGCGDLCMNTGVTNVAQNGNCSTVTLQVACDSVCFGATSVAICHIPPGNPANAHTIYVGASAVPAHLSHGDVLGACPGTGVGNGNGNGNGSGNGNGNGLGQVTICHIPPGNPANAHTITVGASAVPAHLAHGDQLGACGGSGTGSGSSPRNYMDISVPCGVVGTIANSLGLPMEVISNDTASGITGIRVWDIDGCSEEHPAWEITYEVCDTGGCGSGVCAPLVAYHVGGCTQYEEAVMGAVSYNRMGQGGEGGALLQWVVYPSVTAGTFTVVATCPDCVGEYQLSVVDALGQVILRDRLNLGQSAYERTIDLGSRAAGVYAVVIENATSRLVRKVVKQ